jgi:ABC-type sugar transport system ATPase subunit
MTVYDNMASPMRSKLYHKDEDYIKTRVHEIAAMMGMEHLLERLPSQLSNGQKQRVAMGRALVRMPKVYLMDEPLAHLDAKLRNAMRTELKSIQANFGTTSIYVTHDFMEAMALGDRIAIINKGKIVQIGSGDEIYYMPCNEFTAELMGDPQINIIPAEIYKSGSGYGAEMIVNGSKVRHELPEDKGVFAKIQERGLVKVDLGIRPQHIKYAFAPADGYFKTTVYSYESIGNKSVITAECGAYQLRMIAPNGLNVEIDSDIFIKLELDRSILFDPDSKKYLTRYDEEAIKSFAVKEVQ